MSVENADTGGVGRIYVEDYAGNSVASISTQQESWMEDSVLPRSMYRGTKGMKEGSTEFLIKHPLETKTGYKLRLSQSVLFNVFMKTVHFLSGQVFQSNLIFEEGVSEDFKRQMAECDSKGNDINVFTKRVFINGLAKGASHILVESPKTDGGAMSKADEKKLGIRPYLREIRAEDMLGWIIDESGVLLQIRFKETTTEREGDYGFKTVKQIRVYNSDGTWEIHKEGKDGAWKQDDSGTLSYKGIPMATYIPGEESTIITGNTPLMDLAELNLTHYQSYSDQRNILSVARVPILFGRHIELKEMPSGVAEMVVSDDDNALIEYVEITGKSIEAGANDVEDIERKMALWGLQQLIPNTTQKTATEKQLNSKESDSSLGTWATEFERCLQKTFEIFEEMQNREFPEQGVTLNREYSIGMMSKEEGNLILAMKKEGILATENAFDEFQRRGIIHESVVWEDVEKLKEADQMTEENSITAMAGKLFGQQGPGKNQTGEE